MWDAGEERCMSVAWPDSVKDDLKAALDDALHAVFEHTVPDPHERGDLIVANSADVEQAGDGVYLVHVWWPHGVTKYLDATDAGEDHEAADDHADNPGMVVYSILREHGVPVPTDDPKTGVLFNRGDDVVQVQVRVDADAVRGDD